MSFDPRSFKSISASLLVLVSANIWSCARASRVDAETTEAENSEQTTEKPKFGHYSLEPKRGLMTCDKGCDPLEGRDDAARYFVENYNAKKVGDSQIYTNTIRYEHATSDDVDKGFFSTWSNTSGRQFDRLRVNDDGSVNNVTAETQIAMRAHVASAAITETPNWSPHGVLTDSQWPYSQEQPSYDEKVPEPLAVNTYNDLYETPPSTNELDLGAEGPYPNLVRSYSESDSDQ